MISSNRKTGVSRSARRRIAVLAIPLLAPLICYAQHGPPFTIGDILGKPSSIAMASASRERAKLRRIRKKAESAYQEKIALARERSVERLKRSPKPAVALAQATKRARTEMKIPPTIQIRHLQTVSLTFLNPNQRPIAGLSVTPAALRQNGARQELPPETTDREGRLKIADIAELPVDLEFHLPSPSTPGAPDEWRFRDPERTPLTLSDFSGTERLARTDGGTRGLRISAVFKGRGETRRQRIHGGGIAFDCFAPAKKASAKPAVRIVTVDHTLEAPPFVLERSVADIDLELPSGSEDARIWLPAVREETASGDDPAEEEIQADRDGRTARFKLPASDSQRKPPPLRLSRETDAGEWEAVIEEYALDPYVDSNRIDAPPLNLIRLKDVRLPEGIDVLARESDLATLYPDLKPTAPPKKRKPRPPAPIPGSDNGDGSRWITLASAGADLRVRPNPAGNDEWVEAVRLMRPDAGSVGGFRVGDAFEEVDKKLGPPSSRMLSASDLVPQTTLSYLDDGVRFYESGGKIGSIEILREKTLIEEGTTAFVARRPFKVFVESFETASDRTIASRDDFESYLSRTGAVKIVESRKDADYVLSARIPEFEENKDALLGAVPLKYACEGKLLYRLARTNGDHSDDENDKPLDNVPDEILTSQIKADWTGQAAIAGLGLILLDRAIKGDDKAKLAVALLLGAGGIEVLQRSAQRVSERAPRLVEQELFQRLADHLYNEFEYSGRVEALDYRSGMMTVSLGRSEGVRTASGTGVPTMFEMSVGGEPLPYKEEGLSADFYAAQVVSIDEHSCRCVLKRITRKVRKVREETKAEDALEMARHLPQPRTGALSVKIRNRLLPLDGLDSPS